VTILRGGIGKGSLWNLAGLGLPLAVAVVAVPFIVRGLGVERFGVLALTWAIIGVASILDFGIGRALTQVVASRRAAGETEDLPALVLTAVVLLGALGVVGAAALAVLASSLSQDVFRIGPALKAEAERAIVILGISLPFVLCGSAMQGVLEGHLRFDLSNLVRMPLLLLNYLAPLAMLPWTTDLGWIVGGMVLTRCLGFAAYSILAWKLISSPKAVTRFRLGMLMPVLRVAGWMSVSTLVAAAIVYLDRFAIAVLDSMSAVAFYATPYEIVSRLSLLAGAVGATLLPIFSSLADKSPRQVQSIVGRGLRYVVLLVFPATMVVVLFAEQGLALWLNDRFAQASTRVAQILAAGIFVNSLAMVPLILLYGAGRAATVARLHVVELPLYALLLWLLVSRFGAEGAAFAWTVRAAVDSALLFVIARRFYVTSDLRVWRVALAMAAGLAALGLGIAMPGLHARLVYGAACLAAFALYAWLGLLSKEERVALFKWRL
jgi:O-antigen/teichoic acid export membrane protein